MNYTVCKRCRRSLYSEDWDYLLNVTEMHVAICSATEDEQGYEGYRSREEWLNR